MVGVDEAGRGPLAGPVVAAAVVLGAQPPGGLDDSKVLSAKKRAVLDAAIRESCAWAVGVASAGEIDRMNVLAATMLAMTRSVAKLTQGLAAHGITPDTVLVDGNLTPQDRAEGWHWPARAIVGGDASEPVISAASIVAKEWRDRIMRAAAEQHPHYGWSRNMGYGTREHCEALERHGPTPLHRRSFAPLKGMIEAGAISADETQAHLAIPVEPLKRAP